MIKHIDFSSEEMNISFILGALIMIISHGIHLVQPEYHLFFQLSFIIGYTLFMITPILLGKKINIYKLLYKFSIIIIVIIGIYLDNIYINKEMHNNNNNNNNNTQ